MPTISRSNSGASKKGRGSKAERAVVASRDEPASLLLASAFAFLRRFVDETGYVTDAERGDERLDQRGRHLGRPQPAGQQIVHQEERRRHRTS